MTTSLSDLGLTCASGNTADIKTAMPASGSYVAGDIVFESTTGVKVSGWKRLTTGSGHVLNTDWGYFSAGTLLTASLATTSGTSIDFISIPTGVKRITGMPSGVSTSGTSTLMIQIGSSSVATTGYLGGHLQAASGAAVALSGLTTGFALGVPTAANMTLRGLFTLVLQSASTNLWCYTAATSDSTNDRDWSCSGDKTLSGAIDRLRVTTVGGADTFDAGSLALLLEY